VWALTFRNMQFRLRQFLIAIVGTAVVFAMALLVTGIREGFETEAERTLDAIGGDAWMVPVDSSGPFTGFSFVDAAQAQQIRRLPGVSRADPVLLVPQTVREGSGLEIVTVVGHPVGGLGEPPPEDGRRARALGEAVVDETLGVDLRERFTMKGRRFTVVGQVSGQTSAGGAPTVYVPIRDVQALAFGGARLARAVVITGTPRTVPEEFRVMSRGEVREDLLRPLRNAASAINNTRLLLWLVAAVIVGAVMYMSALERVRDFAVLKAVGATTRTLVASLAVEAVIACLLAAGLAIGFARVLRPIIPLPVTYTAGAYAALPVVAVLVGMLASVAGMRRAVGTDPAAAFAGT
jgi:putative ABC transport system permease protein